MKRQASDQSQQLISQSQSDKDKQQTKPVKKVNISNQKSIININQNQKSIININKKQQTKKTYQQLRQLKKPPKKIYSPNNDSQPQQSAIKTNKFKTQQFKDLPKRIIKQYEQKLIKDLETKSSILPISSSQTNKILIYLKQIHLQQQINQYQEHIDLWIGKIRGFQENIEKIKSTEGPFQKKANNMSKLKDFLYVQRKRRR